MGACRYPLPDPCLARRRCLVTGAGWRLSGPSRAACVTWNRKIPVLSGPCITRAGLGDGRILITEFPRLIRSLTEIQNVAISPGSVNSGSPAALSAENTKKSLTRVNRFEIVAVSTTHMHAAHVLDRAGLRPSEISLACHVFKTISAETWWPLRGIVRFSVAL